MPPLLCFLQVFFLMLLLFVLVLLVIPHSLFFSPVPPVPSFTCISHSRSVAFFFFFIFLSPSSSPSFHRLKQLFSCYVSLFFCCCCYLRYCNCDGSLLPYLCLLLSLVLFCPSHRSFFFLFFFRCTHISLRNVCRVALICFFFLRPFFMTKPSCCATRGFFAC